MSNKNGRIWKFFIANSEIGIGILILAIYSFLVVFLTKAALTKYDDNFLESLLASAISIIADILIFGVILVAYNKVLERRRNIRRWIEEIDDYRYWNEPEAAYRILGNLKRLNRENIYGFDLSNCFLKKLNLANLKFENVNFENAILDEANLENQVLSNCSFFRALLRKANLKNANLENTNFIEADLEGANLSGANLKNSHISSIYALSKFNLIRPNLKNAIITGAMFNDSNLQSADLQGAVVMEHHFSIKNPWIFSMIVDFQGADLSFADLRDLKILRRNQMSRKLDVIEPLAHDAEKEKVAEILSKAFSLSDTTMDADIKRMIEAKKPGIFSFQWKMTELQKEAEKKTLGSKTS